MLCTSAHMWKTRKFVSTSLREVEGENNPTPVIPDQVSNRSPNPLVSHYREWSVNLSDIFQQEVVTRVLSPFMLQITQSTTNDPIN